MAAADRFCPRCGESLLASAGPAPTTGTEKQPSSPPVRRRSKMMWLWVLITIGVVVVFGLVVLSFFPIGENEVTRQDDPPRVVEESEGPETTTFVEVPGSAPAVTEPEIEEMEPERAAAAPDNRLSERDAIAGLSTASPPEGDLSEAGAVATLLGWVTTNDHYDVRDSCIGVRSQGYSNRGYTIELLALNCDGRDGLLGRWRVDTLTHDVYEQKPDGRYLSP